MRIERDIRSKVRTNVKGNGQECPFLTCSLCGRAFHRTRQGGREINRKIKIKVKSSGREYPFPDSRWRERQTAGSSPFSPLIAAANGSE